MHSKLTFYPSVTLVLNCTVFLSGCRSLSLITSAWWLLEILSAFDCVYHYFLGVCHCTSLHLTYTVSLASLPLPPSRRVCHPVAQVSRIVALSLTELTVLTLIWARHDKRHKTKQGMATDWQVEESFKDFAEKKEYFMNTNMLVHNICVQMCLWIICFVSPPFQMFHPYITGS